jgi:hypothetical protein
VPIPVAERFTASVCSPFPAELLGLNPAGVMDVCFFWMLRVVRYRSLRRTDPSSRGVLPTVVCHCVWSRNLKNETVLALVGLLRQKKILVWTLFSRLLSGSTSVRRVEIWSNNYWKTCSVLCCFLLLYDFQVHYPNVKQKRGVFVGWSLRGLLTSVVLPARFACKSGIQFTCTRDGILNGFAKKGDS